ncbi:MAG TPA: OmpA family protein [Stellaceae bacterium]|nr:OmpA family protein [Stellaceae bacterium]
MRSTTRTALIALAIGASLLVQARAQADVRLFEDTPSVEQLRAILIPESHGGVTRRIEIPRPVDAARPIQPAASTGTTFQPQSDTAPTSGTSAPAAAPAPQQIAPTPGPAKRTEAKAAPATDAANAVGFRINFAFNSAVIPPAHFAQLDRVAELLREEPALSLAVEGHTDAVGNADYNIELSRRRAEAVVHYLTDHGVDGQRLMAVGKGKTEPLVANPLDGRNRRVQFLRLRPETTS